MWTDAMIIILLSSRGWFLLTEHQMLQFAMETNPDGLLIISFFICKLTFYFIFLLAIDTFGD